ncbi:hypothetical protein [Pistricoccus aurantiacus]|uniref:hypothetical protein n=1 Tax=Pistricoccus aurantiacus TaxID=1883414 RepID=UPI00363F5497
MTLLHALALTLALLHALTLTHSLALLHALTLTHSLALLHALTLTHSLALLHASALTHSLALLHALTLTLTLLHASALTHSLALLHASALALLHALALTHPLARHLGQCHSLLLGTHLHLLMVLGADAVALFRGSRIAHLRTMRLPLLIIHELATIDGLIRLRQYRGSKCHHGA